MGAGGRGTVTYQTGHIGCRTRLYYPTLKTPFHTYCKTGDLTIELSEKDPFRSTVHLY